MDNYTQRLLSNNHYNVWTIDYSGIAIFSNTVISLNQIFPNSSSLSSSSSASFVFSYFGIISILEFVLLSFKRKFKH